MKKKERKSTEKEKWDSTMGKALWCKVFWEVDEKNFQVVDKVSHTFSTVVEKPVEN